MDFTHEKGALQEVIAAQRKALGKAGWRRLDISRLEAPLSQLPGSGVIAIYASRRHEPDIPAIIEELRRQGRQVLLPGLPREPGWAWATDELRPGWAGIPEPTGPGMGIRALGQMDVIVVPCLAIPRDGSWLGMGGGWYDRALRHCRLGTPVWAPTNADKVLPALPDEPHDLSINAVVTESGFAHLGTGSVS